MATNAKRYELTGIRFWLDKAPEYFSRWRIFPRVFISMYIYLLYDVVQWFMLLPDPNTQQAGLVSVLVGSGAAWFGLYVNSVPSSVKLEQNNASSSQRK
jgi:hypothetical protein